MRYHDIERLKQAASRYKADATCLGDIEELVDYAIDKLDEPSGVRKVDNGDNTETWYGLPVVVPVGLVPDGEVPSCVRSRQLIPDEAGQAIRGVSGAGVVTSINGTRHGSGELRILLADKTQPGTWTPPASLAPGEYEWNGVSLSDSGFESEWAKKALRDWTDPPKRGRWRVNEDGTATYLGE